MAFRSPVEARLASLGCLEAPRCARGRALPPVPFRSIVTRLSQHTDTEESEPTGGHGPGWSESGLPGLPAAAGDALPVVQAIGLEAGSGHAQHHQSRSAGRGRPFGGPRGCSLCSEAAGLVWGPFCSSPCGAAGGPRAGGAGLGPRGAQAELRGGAEARRPASARLEATPVAPAACDPLPTAKQVARRRRKGTKPKGLRGPCPAGLPLRGRGGREALGASPSPPPRRARG